MGGSLFKLSSKTTKITEILKLIKWSYRVLVYHSQIKSNDLSHLDFIIVDPSLSSNLKKFHQYFDDDSFVKVLSLLEQNELMSDLVVVIEADIDIVVQRRLARGSSAKTKGDSATFALKKAFNVIEKQNTSINLVTVDYNHFSSLERNIQHIGELCDRARLGS